MVNGYTTPTLVEAETRISGLSSSSTPSLETVFNWINEESKNIEVRTGEVFSSTVVSSEYVDYDGDNILRFSKSPLLSIENIQYNIYGQGMVPSWVSFSEGFDQNYLLYEDRGEVEFIPGVNRTVKYTPNPGKKKFCLSYTYGFSKTPLEIQKLATMIVAKRVIMSLANSQANSEGGSVQIGTIKIEDPTIFGLNHMKFLNAEIEFGFQNIGRTVKTFRLSRVYD